MGNTSVINYMKLKSLLKELDQTSHDISDYDSYVIIKTNENKEGFEEYPIIEIDFEDDDKEITFITSQYSEENKDFSPLKTQDLLKHIQELKPKYLKYEIFSGSAMVDLDEEYQGRVDIPLIAVGFDKKHRKVGLVQAEQKED
jgi:hypothetical protein